MRREPGRRLSFTPAEEVFEVLDAPEEPANVHLELHLAGRLDRSRLEAAARAACAVHPMLNLSRERGRRLHLAPSWRHDGPAMPAVVELGGSGPLTSTAEVTAGFISTAIDLSTAPGVRLALIRREAGDVLVMSAHHAVTDGVGALRLLRSIARAYVGAADEVPAVNPLQARDLRRTVARMPPQSDGVAAPVRTRGRFVRIAADEARSAPGYGLARTIVPRPRSEVGATVNDLLIEAVHRAIAGWNAAHGEAPGPVDLLVPVNVRPQAWRSEVVANLCMAGHVVLGGHAGGDDLQPRAAVAQQMAWIKSGRDFERALATPPWKRTAILIALRALARRVAPLTAIVSNLGDVGDPPDFGLAPAGIWFSPPAPMPIGVAVGAVGLGERVFITVRHRWSRLGEGAADRFTQMVAHAATGHPDRHGSAPS